MLSGLTKEAIDERYPVPVISSLDANQMILNFCVAVFLLTSGLSLYFKSKVLDDNNPSVKDATLASLYCVIVFVSCIPAYVVKAKFTDLSSISYPANVWLSVSDVSPKLGLSLVHVTGLFTQKAFSKTMRRILRGWIESWKDTLLRLKSLVRPPTSIHPWK